MNKQEESWWRSLKGGNNSPLPDSVVARLTWYDRQVRRQRRGSYGLESAIILVAAAIPVATTFGASSWVVGSLGGATTVLAGLRQLLRPGENWIRVSGTFVAIQREAVVWSVGGEPYNDERATGKLVETVENLVAQETSRWADLRALQPTAEDRVETPRSVLAPTSQ